MNAVSKKYVHDVSPICRSDIFSDDLLDNVVVFETRRLSRLKIRRAFKYIDTNSSGGISLDEFREIILLLNVNLHKSVISDIFDHINRNCNGTIGLHEFEEFVETPIEPECRIKSDFALNLAQPSLFIKFHIWHVKSRPLNFTLSSGVNDISAYFDLSSNPEMGRCLKHGARLFYINSAPVENASYKEIQATLNSTQCPFILVFQNLDSSKKPGELTVFKDINFDEWANLLSPAEKKLFYEPLENHSDSESFSEDSNQRVLQYYNHCKHCPHEEAWYLHVHLLMEDETYSAASNALTCVIMLLIAISTFTYIFQTLPAWEHWEIWQSLEGVISIAFTVEFLLRICSCRSIRIYMADFMNVVDFCAVIPYWLELASNGIFDPELLRVVRVIRLLRLIRLAKSSSLQDILNIFKLTYDESIQWIIMFMYLGLVMSVVVSSFFFIFEVGDEISFGSCSDLSDDEFCENDTADVLYDNLTVYSTSVDECESFCDEFTERGCCSFNQLNGMCQFFNSSVSNATNSSSLYYSGLCVSEVLNIRRDGSESPFFNIPISLWFTHVTMTMVGYGEFAAVSYGGRLVAVFAALCGPLFLALPLIIVGSHFTMAIYSTRMTKLTREAGKKSTVIKMLELVNDVVGMQLFNPKDQLPFLGSNINLTSKQKIETVLLFEHGWFYLPFATDDKVGIIRLTQFKLFALFGIFGKKMKKLMNRKNKQIRDLKSALIMLNQRTISPSRPRTVKIVDYADEEDVKKINVSKAKRSSSVNFMEHIPGDLPIVGSTHHTRRSSGGTAVSFMGGDTKSYVSPRKLVEYCSFGEVKTNEALETSITRTDYSGSASLAVGGVKSNKPNRQEMAIELLSEGKKEPINDGGVPC